MADVITDDLTAVPAGVTQQETYSGTPRWRDGLTSPDDYVDDLRHPIKRMEIFEEMGQGDDAVHTAIDARRQELVAANWALSSADTSDRGTEILEFVEDNVYPILDNLLRWLGTGAMQYGFGCIEPVLGWSDTPPVSSVSRGDVVRPTRSGQRRIYVRHLAHLLPRSIQSFRVGRTAPTEPVLLQSVRQATYDGERYLRNDVSADKLLLWSYNRQGDDYWGVPPARHCYKAWKFKTQIERLNLMHLDKFAVGTPVAEEGEGWQQADRDRLATYLKAWRSGTANYILHPNGGSISIVGDEGKSTINALEWVRYYNLAVAKTYLTQMTELGSTETGARALGEVFYSQMGGIVQADCEEVANLINNRLIVPLVLYNFGPQKVYPVFAPSQRVRAGSGVATVLQQLIASKAIHPRPEDEAYLRDVFELPSVELKTLQDEQEQRDTTAAAIAAATPAPTDPKIDPKADPKTDPAPADKTPLRIAAAAIALAAGLVDGAPPAAVSGQTTYRTPEYSAWEYGIVKPDVLTRDLDMQSSRAASEVQDVYQLIDADLVRQVTELAAQGAAVLSAGVRSIAVPDKLRSQLRIVMFGAAQRARDYGGQSVVNEIERQTGPEAIGPQRPPSAMYAGLFDRLKSGFKKLFGKDDEPTPADLHLAAEVDRAVEDEIDRREQSARSAALTALAQAAGAIASTLASVASTAAKAGLIGLSTGRTQSNVQGVVNVGFGIGRSETAQSIAAPAAGGAGGGGNRSGLRDGNGNPVDLVAKIYSAVMDLGTCDECAKWDGAEFPIDYPEDFTGVQAPNPRCAGGLGRCRCIWIYITSREALPLVPASKGPQPIRRAA